MLHRVRSQLALVKTWGCPSSMLSQNTVHSLLSFPPLLAPRGHFPAMEGKYYRYAEHCESSDGALEWPPVVTRFPFHCTSYINDYSSGRAGLDTLQVCWTEHQDADHNGKGSSWPLPQQDRGICVKDHTEGSYSPRTGRLCTLRSLFRPINYPSLKGWWFSTKSDLPLRKSRAAAVLSRIHFYSAVSFRPTQPNM